MNICLCLLCRGALLKILYTISGTYVSVDQLQKLLARSISHLVNKCATYDDLNFIYPVKFIAFNINSRLFSCLDTI